VKGKGVVRDGAGFEEWSWVRIFILPAAGANVRVAKFGGGMEKWADSKKLIFLKNI